MSATKEAFAQIGEYDAMQEYLEDDLEDRSPESIKFHEWALNAKLSEVCSDIRINPAGIHAFQKWFWNILWEDEQLEAEHHANRIDLAKKLYGYYRQVYNQQAVA